jgi:DNA polymerase
MDALAALALQLEWGADEALEVAPVDRTRLVAGVAVPLAVSVAPLVRASMAPAVARPGPVSRAREVAQAAATLSELRAALAAFRDCPLAATATNLVFSDGNPAAGLVLVGEAPGAEEDLSGKPFVGASGQLLDRMLASVGLDRTQLLITNLIPWRPPGNRPPTESEVQMCLPFLLRHLCLLRPRVIVTLGALSTRALTGRDDGIRRLRGRWTQIELEGVGGVKMLPMLHPAYLLRTPGAKREAWADLLALRVKLDGLGNS